MNKEPIIESFRRWHDESPERRFAGAEVKIMLDRIDYLEGEVDKLGADRDLMIRKFNEDLANAIEFYAKPGTEDGKLPCSISEMNRRIALHVKERNEKK